MRGRPAATVCGLLLVLGCSPDRDSSASDSAPDTTTLGGDCRTALRQHLPALADALLNASNQRKGRRSWQLAVDRVTPQLEGAGCSSDRVSLLVDSTLRRGAEAVRTLAAEAGKLGRIRREIPLACSELMPQVDLSWRPVWRESGDSRLLWLELVVKNESGIKLYVQFAGDAKLSGVLPGQPPFEWGGSSADYVEVPSRTTIRQKLLNYAGHPVEVSAGGLLKSVSLSVGVGGLHSRWVPNCGVRRVPRA